MRQGDMSDCMYVIKSGQVCVLIDPSFTPGGDHVPEMDPKKLVQVQTDG